VAVSEEWLRELADRMTQAPGMVAVMLGGSRARGDHTAESDLDLGLYYDVPLNTTALGELAREVAGSEARVTEPGEWGHWVNGGAWLTVNGTQVDWLYRDVNRVHASWDAAKQGSYRFHAQIGHPLGVPDFAYAGEVALGIILADPTGHLSHLQRQITAYPPRLTEALVEGLWEASFLIDNARKAVSRSDATFVAGCLFRVVCLCAHALHGRSGRWLVNEKGAVASAARLGIAPDDFARRAHDVVAHLDADPHELAVALDNADDLVRDTASACQPSP
jgi:hypothetical protein